MSDAYFNLVKAVKKAIAEPEEVIDILELRSAVEAAEQELEPWQREELCQTK